MIVFNSKHDLSLDESWDFHEKGRLEAIDIPF